MSTNQPTRGQSSEQPSSQPSDPSDAVSQTHKVVRPLWKRVPTLDLPAGTMIGPYKILDLLGEGGFGVVYLAEQTAPVQRRVALKIIKPGMDSRAVIARFEQERQALAVMDHPNVARATPKSRIFGCPSGVTRMLPGFRSR